jgi:excisionase-like protein
MTAGRLTLERWLEQTYAADCRPTLNTARRWAAKGKLEPPAVKEGRSYYVDPGTRYNANPTPGRPLRLVDRLRAEAESSHASGPSR